MRVFLEAGKRRVFACAVDWPGWCRSGKNDEAALETLAGYGPRYRAVLVAGGVNGPSEEAASRFEIVERVEGRSADFGSLQAVTEIDRTPPSPVELQRAVDVLRAAWSYLDAVVAAAPSALRKGPRGGGRDRDAIAEHVVGAEIEYGRHLGLDRRRASWADPESVALLRQEIAAVIAAGDPPPPQPAKRWPTRTGARRVAWHVLDHAWEIEDRSVKSGT
jgi:hypothetical protein